MTRWNLAWLLGLPAVVLTALTLCYAAPARDRDPNYRLVRTVVDVLAEVDQHYVKPLDEKQMEALVENMINGGLERLDPYSTYFNADEYRAFETQSEGNFGGVGIHMGIDPQTGRLMVVSPMVGTPAYEAGVLAGDLILKIEDKTTENLRVTEAAKLIQGEPGKEIRITVLHEGDQQPAELTMKRAIIEIHTVLGWKRDAADPKKWDYMADADKRVAYVRLVQFNEHSARDLRAALEDIQKAGARGLVLDLRDNPGGLLKSAVEISDMFLASGNIVSTRNRHGKGRSWEAKEEDTLFLPAAEHPVAVLVNKNSASASEILAAALQDHGRAVVIGERSYGKGSVQEVFRMNHSAPQTALKLTTQTYWRPSGHNIHRLPDSKEADEWGVKPDKGMEVSLKDDERLRYLEWRRQQDIYRAKPRPEPAGKPAFVDRVMEKALEALRAKLPGQKAGRFVDVGPAVRG